MTFPALYRWLCARHAAYLVSATLICYSLTGTAQAQEPQLGRLFSTPLERILLEGLRQRSDQMPATQTLDDENALELPVDATGTGRAPPPDNLEISVGGSVLRSDGDNTLWINGVPVTQQQLPAGMRIVQHRHLLALQISKGSNEVLVLPGQRLHMASLTISTVPPGHATPAQSSDLRQTLDQVMEYMP